jgi:DNA-binding IclR family transcriptional regulator
VAPAAAKAPGEIKAGTKQAQLVEMLEREGGASLDEIVAATSWLPHSARAMLTGLKKRGYTIDSDKVDGVRRYRATKAAS